MKIYYYLAAVYGEGNFGDCAFGGTDANCPATATDGTTTDEEESTAKPDKTTREPRASTGGQPTSPGVKQGSSGFDLGLALTLIIIPLIALCSYVWWLRAGRRSQGN